MNLNDRSFKPYNKQNDTIPYKKNVIILLIISTLFRMGGGGGGGQKGPPYQFSPCNFYKRSY